MYYTSYFAKVKNIPKDKYKFAAITSSKPSFCDDNTLDWSFLGPSKDLLLGYKNGSISEQEYTTIYLEHLDEIWPSVKQKLINHKDDNIVLLCYEAPDKFCHRHLLRVFLNSKHINCEELK